MVDTPSAAADLPSLEDAAAALEDFADFHTRTYCITTYEHGRLARETPLPDTVAEYYVGGLRRNLTVRHIRAALTGLAEALERVDDLEQLGTAAYAERVWKQAQLRNLEIRGGKFELDITEVEHLASAYVAFAHTLLGDAENYSETSVQYRAKIAEEPTAYILTVQRTGVGKLTPHQARREAEAERDEALERVRTLEAGLLPRHEADAAARLARKLEEGSADVAVLQPQDVEDLRAILDLVSGTAAPEQRETQAETVADETPSVGTEDGGK